MGEPIRWSVSVDKETDAIAEILQHRYSAQCGVQRSRLVQFLFKSWYRLNMSAATVAAALEQQQGINQAILSEEITTFNNSSQPEFPAQIAAPIAGPKKPLRRVAPLGDASRRREIGGISRRSALGELAVLLASCPPFAGKVRPFKSNSFRRVA